ncbi:MAG: sigma-70 family RNA polymerase sigma factor [Verrucomicrobia bacterium]|nr:sigma-70 family RNA polymerase sigma factor [Verrucomicrobiota bacterium]
MSDVTLLLHAIERGDSTAADQLFPLVYQELRRLAAAKMAKERPGHTLQATALVHEAWLRLGGDKSPKWEGRAHFFGAAAEAMRRILVDHARRKQAERRGGGAHPHVGVTNLDIAAEQTQDDQLLAVNEALEKFAKVDVEKAELVKLRYFVGLTLEEAASAQGVSLATAKRSWAYARAWLYREMQR